MGMDRNDLAELLADAEQRISELERHVARQRDVLAALEAAGRGTSETTTIARDLLATMERNLRNEKAERMRLLGRLRR